MVQIIICEFEHININYDFFLQAGKRSLDFILDTVSADHALLPILELLKVTGTLFLVGAPDKPLQLPAFPLIFGKTNFDDHAFE